MEVGALRHSTSRKITAPIRWAILGAKNCARWVRSFIVNVFRVVYHSLPFSEYQKNILKGWFYSKGPFLFRHTLSYRYWGSNQQMDASKSEAKILEGALESQITGQNAAILFSHPDEQDTYVPYREFENSPYP
jgi:hypothetical protein